MHTVMVITGGLAFLAICLVAGRVLGGSGTTPVRRSIDVFLPLWLIAALANMWIGVTHAGYTVAQEFPILLVSYSTSNRDRPADPVLEGLTSSRAGRTCTLP